MPGVYYAPGKYWGRIVAQKLGKSKNKGTPQWTVAVKVLGTIDPADPGTYVPCDPGRDYERTVYRYLTEKTMDRFMDDLRKLAETAQKDFALPGVQCLDEDDAGCLDFRGVELALDCRHEVYEGQPKERWDFDLGGGGAAEVTPLEQSELRQLNALFAKQLKPAKATGKQPTKTAAPAREPVAAQTGNGDIPF